MPSGGCSPLHRDRGGGGESLNLDCIGEGTIIKLSLEAVILIHV